MANPLVKELFYGFLEGTPLNKKCADALAKLNAEVHTNVINFCTN